jgi:hypothetical protein
MKITDVPNAFLVGKIVKSTKKYSGKKHVFHEYALQLDYDSNFPSHLRKKHLSIAYIFAVNKIIKKIGQTSGKNGIDGCINFYARSGQDDPGINRFAVNWVIREELEKGNQVDVYMIYMDLIEVSVPGLFRHETIFTPVSAKGIEEVCMRQYKEVEKSYPDWNYQESDTKLPHYIHEAYGQYRIDRSKK